MQPLQMPDSRASYNRISNNPDIIEGCRQVEGKLEPYKRSTAETGTGGIYASAVDISKWMLMQLNDEAYGTDTLQRLFSRAIHKDIWTPQIFIPASKYGAYNTHFGAYGLGWFLTDVNGFENVWQYRSGRRYDVGSEPNT